MQCRNNRELGRGDNDRFAAGSREKMMTLRGSSWKEKDSEKTRVLIVQEKLPSC